MIALDGGASLAWRFRHHGLESPLATDVVGVAERVLAARAWPLRGVEEMFALRQALPEAGGVERALSSGALIQSYAFRGGSYVFTTPTTPAGSRCASTCRRTDRRPSGT